VHSTRLNRSVGGFTLVELLVVLLLVAIAAGVASLAMRDPSATQLDREAARLVALLEAGRAEARASGLAVRFEVGGVGAPEAFRFVGLPPRSDWPRQWLYEGVHARILGARALLLGPEPLIGAQRIELQLGERRIVVATDGLAPFRPQDEEPS
jgi:general secretion pathway protein H